MEFAITEINPSIESGTCDQLPKEGGFFKDKRYLAISGDQIAFIARKKGMEDVFPNSTQGDVKIAVGARDSYLRVSRNIAVNIEARDIQFGNDVKGKAEMRGGIRFLKSDGAIHPLLGDSQEVLTEDFFRQSLAKSLENAFHPILKTIFAQQDYNPGMAATGLNDLLDERTNAAKVKEQLYRQGLGISDHFRIKNVESEEADKKREKKKKREESLQEEMLDIADDTLQTKARIDGERKKSNAKHMLEVDRKQSDIVLAELDRQQKNVLAAAEIEEAIKEERIQQSELEKQKNAALTKEEIEREKIKTEKERALAAQEVEKRKHDMEALIEESNLRMEKLEKALEESRKNEEQIEEIENPIALSSIWKVYDNRTRDLIQTNLRSGSQLESGKKLLRVEITVDKPAYVYVLLYNSNHEWQRLVPEGGALTDGRKLGIKRDNRQEAQKPCLWPPSDLDVPFWALDETPGIENLIVMASIEPLDIVELMSTTEINRLKDSFASTGTRGFCVPSTPDIKEKADYNSIYEQVIGSGAVVDEMVIRHV